MAVTLTDKTLQSWPPSGWEFSTRLPNGETWSAPSPLNFSFRQQVANIIAWRKANPVVATKLNLSVAWDAVSAELIQQTVERLQRMPRGEVYLQSTDVPIVEAEKKSLWQSAKSLVAAATSGEETLREWLGEGGVPVAHDLAERRAQVCNICPKNDQTHWSKFFFGSAANSIRKIVERKNHLKLSTTFDPELGSCTACLCPLETKVHVPLKHILAHMDEETKAKLHVSCWITHETP